MASEDEYQQRRFFKTEDEYEMPYLIKAGNHISVWHPLIYGPIETYIKSDDFIVTDVKGRVLKLVTNKNNIDGKEIK